MKILKFFQKKTLLSKLLHDFDSIDEDYLTHSNSGYCGDSKAAVVYSTVLNLENAVMFAEAESLLPKAKPSRRHQLYYVMWVIACRRQENKLKQDMISLYYHEQDEKVAEHIVQLLIKTPSSIYDPPAFNILSPALDLNPPASAKNGELRYLGLLARSLNFHPQEIVKASHLDLYDAAGRMLKVSPADADRYYISYKLAEIGAYSKHPDVEKTLLSRLEQSKDNDERRRLASDIAYNYPVPADSIVVSTLLELSTKRNRRDDAIKALGHLPHPAVEEALISYLENDPLGIDLLCCVIKSLGEIKSEKAYPLIAEYLTHSKRDVRLSAIIALPDDEKWVPYFIKILDSDRDPHVKSLALMKLRDNKSREVQMAFMRYARKAIKSKSPDGDKSYVGNAIRYLKEFTEDAEIQDFLKTVPKEQFWL